MESKVWRVLVVVALLAALAAGVFGVLLPKAQVVQEPMGETGSRSFATYLSSLTVGGATTLGGAVTINNNVEVTGTLKVAGTPVAVHDAYGVLASLHLVNQNATIAKTTLIADAPAGIYRISCLIRDLMTGSGSGQVSPAIYMDGTVRAFVFFDSDTQLSNSVVNLTGNNEWSASVIISRSTTVADIEYQIFYYSDGDFDIDLLVERLE